MANPNRVVGVDFARGIVLVAIMIDHVPGNLLESITPRNFAMSDSAEAFVFLSGVSVGLVYYRKALASGLAPVARACLARARKIYSAHLALTLSAVAIFGMFYALSGLPWLVEGHGRSVLFHDPLHGAIGVAMLSHQLGYFNILPLYIVLMAVSPLIIAIARIEPLLALLVAGGAYLGVRLLNLNLPNWPENGSWFLNPFAWQLIFTLGIVAAIWWRDKAPQRSPAIWTLCVLLSVASAVVVSDALGFAPGLRDKVFAALDVGKQNLGVARLVNFLALAYLAATSPYFAQLGRTSVGQALQSLGRNSLSVFAASSVLSAIGQAGLAAWGPSVSEDMAKALNLSYTLACIGGLFALARYLEWRKSGKGGGSGLTDGAQGRVAFWRSPRLAFARRISAS